MFRRKRRQPVQTADGTAHCALCGTEVELDDDGRCKLGHRVIIPEPVFDEPPTSLEEGSPDESGPDESGPDESGPEGLDPSHAADAGVPVVPGVEDSWASDNDADPHGEDALVEPETAVAGDVPATGDDKAGSPEDDGIGASRARLLEAASWFSVAAEPTVDTAADDAYAEAGEQDNRWG